MLAADQSAYRLLFANASLPRGWGIWDICSWNWLALGTHNFSYKQEGIKEFERILTHNKKIVGFQIPKIIYDTFEFSSHLVDEK